MTDEFFPSETPTSSNLQEVSVSELANSIRRTIETTYDRVRVRGELGRVTIAKSGHMYADMKDDKAVINTIMWKGSVSRLPFRPEEGLEVIAEGKLSTYPGRSNYQLIAESMVPAGAGALMALLEERKKKLAAEGLFDASRKKPLPWLPQVIGVVTSPTGAVIRDILHRIQDRYPVHVIVWPALVQGEAAARQIEAGIRGFNALPSDGAIPRPDVLIVARGGGSIEDLWPFNEEIVVRAAADSVIPLISAVGHETDTTLIDYVSDIRAPTPTGAAEIAIPVRIELVDRVTVMGQRLVRGLTQSTRRQERELAAIAARLPRPETLLETRQQRFDYAESRLTSALQSAVLRKQGRYDQIGTRLRPEALRQSLTVLERDFRRTSDGLVKGLARVTQIQQTRLENLARRLGKQGPRLSDTRPARRNLDNLGTRLNHAMTRRIDQQDDRLTRTGNMLEALSYHATLERGYVIVRNAQGALMRGRQTAEAAHDLTLTFADGDLAVTNARGTPSAGKATKPTPGKSTQGSLF